MWGLSKLVGALLYPLTPVLVLILVGLWCVWRGKSRKVTSAWLVGALVLTLFWGWEKPAMYAMRTLEGDFTPQSIPADTYGMVILGGGTDGRKVVGPDWPVPMGQGAERLTESLILAKKHPKWRVLFSGGGGNPTQDGEYGVSESEITLDWWRRLGEPVDRIVLENRSRNTLENGAFSTEVVGADKQRTWLLITSAWHMPRAMRIFEAHGWHVVPYPVDRRYNPYIDWTDYSMERGLKMWHMCFREWVGLLSLNFTLPS